MKKINFSVLAIILLFGVSLFPEVEAASSWWRLSNDTNGFIVKVLDDSLEYRLVTFQNSTCDNIEQEISYDDSSSDWKKMSPTRTENEDVLLNVYEIPAIKNYEGVRCQALIVRGTPGVGASSRGYTHQYYAYTVSGQGVPSATSTPTPNASPSPTLKPDVTPSPTATASVKVKDTKTKEVKKANDNSLIYEIGIGVIGILIICGIYKYFSRRKSKSINY